MKLFRYVLLFCLLFVLASCCTDDAHEEFTFPNAEYAVNATDFAIVGDKIYYISDGAVYEIGADEPVFTEFPAQYLSSNGAELAVYGNGQIWCGEETYTIAQTDITSFVYADGTFCWSWQDEDLPQVGFYNVKTGDTISVNPLTGAECKVMPYQGTKILVLCYEMSGVSFLYEFDTDIMKFGMFSQEVSTHLAAYHPIDQTITYFDTACSVSMTAVHTKTKDVQRFNPSEKISADVEKFIFSGESGVFLKQDGTIHVLNDYAEPQDENNVVKVLQVKPTDPNSVPGSKFRFEAISEALLNEHGITLEVQYLDEDKIKQKQLAGDSDYDIYFTDAYELQLSYPIYEPLESYECITEQFDLMLDGIREACTYDGHIFGVFNGLNIHDGVMRCNDEVFTELGLEFPKENWTYQDYYDLAVVAHEKGAVISKYQVCWPADYIARFGDAYDTKSLTDDGTALREMLSILKKLRELQKSSDTENEKILFEIGDSEHGRFFNSEDHYIMSPTFDGTPHLTSTAVFMQMNAASKNKENAAKVIAEYMKLEYGDNPGSGKILFKETAEKLRAQSDAIASNVDLYLRVLQNYKVYYLHSEFLSFANKQMNLYLNDEQDLEYTADQIYARAKMIFEE